MKPPWLSIVSNNKVLDNVEQVLQSEGFAEKRVRSQLGCCRLIGGIGGHRDKLDPRILVLNECEQLEAAFAWQLNFRKQHVDGAAGLQIGLEAVAVLKRHDFAVDAVHHDVYDEFPCQFFVINDCDFNIGYDGGPHATLSILGSPA
jgi:hypothetical protein